MKRDQVIKITQEDALKVVSAVDDSIIHCFMGFMGADWKKESVVELIERSTRFAWTENPFKHNLAVINDGKLYNFGIAYKVEES